jgi:hypothetical protein
MASSAKEESKASSRTRRIATTNAGLIELPIHYRFWIGVTRNSILNVIVNQIADPGPCPAAKETRYAANFSLAAARFASRTVSSSAKSRQIGAE